MDRSLLTRSPAKPATAPLTGEELLQNQSDCWLRGEPLPVEIYLRLYPALNADRELILDLICHEMLLRKRRGDDFQAEEYLRRFPDFAADLKAQFEVQRALSAKTGGFGTLVEAVAGVRLTATAPPAQVGDYEIVRELGRGGMGVVYLARHRELKRLVALKMIQSPVHCCPRQLARFRGEAEVLARLQHPNVVQIYEVGECEGRPFLALEYLPGGGLDRRLNGSPQPPRQAAQLLRVLVRAVGAAHKAGVIHRDLKPANILLATDDTPKITDFGLAKQLDASTGQTTTGDILGTPHYMAPEQAYGRRHDIGPWTDVYALGAIFYELLTGRPPFNGSTVLDTLEQIVSLEPVPPSRLQAKIPRDVEVVCLKCLAKEPSRRYASAEDLAEDLRRFLAGEPIRARPAPLWERTWKWVRRRPALTALSGAAIVFVVMLLAGTFFWLKAAASDARLEAREAKDREAAIQTLADLKEELHQVEASCTAQRWREARSRRESLARHLDLAAPTFAANAAFSDLQARSEELRRSIGLQLTTRERLADFRTRRTEAGFLVMGLAGTDLDTRRSRVRQVVAVAFRLFEAEPESGPGPALEQFTLPPEEQREVAEGCGEMLLGMAQLIADSPANTDSVEQALALLDRATQLHASPGICSARRARYLARLGRETEARAAEERARAYPPVRATEFFLRGIDLYTDNDLTGAVAAFEKALLLEPNHAAAAYALALPHLRLRVAGGPPAVDRAHLWLAQRSLTECISQQPTLPWPYLCRGFALGELGEFTAAEADYAAAELALRARPEEATRYALLVSRGALRLHGNKLDEALADLTAATRLKPQDYQAYVNLARVYQLRHQEDEAVRQLDRAIVLGPATALAALHRTRARLHQEAGRLTAAVDDLEKAADLEPGGENSPQAVEDLLSKGRLLAQNRHYVSAVETFDTALAVQPNHRALLRARAEAHLHLQRRDDALRDLNRLLEGEHEPQEALESLYRARAGIRAQAGDQRGAVEDYTQALRADTDPAVYVARGWSYLALDAALLAQADFDHAVQRQPKNCEAHQGLAYARVKLGHYRDAVEEAEQALRLDATTSGNRYKAVRVFAQASLKAAEDGSLVNAGRRDLSLHYQERAVALLRAVLTDLPAEERKLFWTTTVQQDAALNPVRMCNGFRQLATEFAIAVSGK